MKVLMIVVSVFWHFNVFAKQSEIDRQLPDLKGNYYALVIGNSAYTDPNRLWAPLETALSDAQEVAKTLKKSYGFKNVSLLANADRRQIINAFIELREKINTEDNVLIYYAGHGHLDKDNFSYWIPIDAVGNDVSTYLHQSVIVSELKRIAITAKHTLVISDSCFSGDLLRPSRGASRGLNFVAKTHALPSTNKNISQPFTQEVDRSNYNYFQRVSNDKSVQVITAGGSEYVDDTYGSSGHSPFTYFLLKNLRDNRQKFVTASLLAEKIKPLVGNNATQVPESGVLYGAGDEGGQFVFANTQIAALNLELPDEVPTPNLSEQTIVIPEPVIISGPRNENKSTPWYKNPWFWAGVVVTSGATTYYVTQNGDADSGGGVARTSGTIGQ